MRIGLNALLFSTGENYRQTGISRYVDRLLSTLGELAVDDDLIAYSGRDIADGRWPATALRPARVSVANPAVRIAWENVALPILSRTDRLDVFHGTVNTLPLGIGGTKVVTIHDLAFLRFPEHVTARRYHYLKRMLSSSIRRADAILTPSEFTRQDILATYRVNPERVFVTPLGVAERFRPSPPEQVAAVRATFRLERPYVMSVGTLEPRKNLPRLVEAFAGIASRVPHDLVFAGPSGWLDDDIRARIDKSGLGDRVRRLGFVSDAELVALYSGADTVALPSLYEGFGLPVLEAMACGTVVVTSNSSALPEVAGGAAELVDPSSADSIADGLLAVLSPDGGRAERATASRNRASLFTWQITAETTLAAYRTVAG